MTMALVRKWDISTHSAREDGDFIGYLHRGLPNLISTHSAREDGDCLMTYTAPGQQNFNPLRPRGRRLTSPSYLAVLSIISTHSAREDGDTVIR